LLEVIISKQVDIYIAIATSIFGAVLGLMLSKVFSSEPKNVGVGTSITQVVTINTINNNASEIRKHTQQETEVFMFLGGVFVFVGLTLYGFFRTAILTSLLYGGFFLLSVWIGAVLRSMVSGRFKGIAWSIYLLYVIAFMIMYFIAIDLAFNPLHAPDNFQYVEKIINQAGWSGLERSFIIDDLLWFVVHLCGVCALIFTLWQITMSLLHIIVAGNSISSGNPDSWIVRKTAKYCTPWSNIIFFTLFILFGGAMVSGIFLHWVQHEIPIILKELINIVLYGRG
jgi:hypothetical protein